jgi:hypothetical protein
LTVQSKTRLKRSRRAPIPAINVQRLDFALASGIEIQWRADFPANAARKFDAGEPNGLTFPKEEQ